MRPQYVMSCMFDAITLRNCKNKEKKLNTALLKAFNTDLVAGCGSPGSERCGRNASCSAYLRESECCVAATEPV
jgi:hypothetical protein